MANYFTSEAGSGGNAKYIQAGTVTVQSTYTFTATASVGDLVGFVKVPRDAIVNHVMFNSVGGDHVDLGTTESTDAYYNSSSATTTLHHAYPLGQISLSDAASVLYTILGAKVLVAASSPTETMTMTVQYFCDAPQTSSA